ncbi:hypothetical protein VNO77_03618 [Canavalia gladiata]|uniref:Uncharacterized protein n=1 Tax=Canavalia gladiata TaxID=3824 RepID=A0AAN9R8B2_CANGL
MQGSSVNHASIPIPLNLEMCISFLNGTEHERIHRGFPFYFERDERRLANLDVNGENSTGSQRSESFLSVPDRASQFAELIPSSAKKKIAPNLRFPSFIDFSFLKGKKKKIRYRNRDPKQRARMLHTGVDDDDDDDDVDDDGCFRERRGSLRRR